MKKIVALGVLVAFIVFGGRFYYKNLRGVWPAILPTRENIVELISESELQPGVNDSGFPLRIPDGYRMSVLADGFEKPRDLLAGPDGQIFVSDMNAGSIYLIGENEKTELISELRRPHGLEIDCNGNICDLFVAEEDGVSVYEYDSLAKQATGRRQIAELPTGGRHTSRSLLIVSDEGQKKLLVSIGSSCDTCLESDNRRGAILSLGLSGENSKIYASGLRNAVFMAKMPSSGQVWVTEMGRDFLGDDLPPDEINIVNEQGFYGWPYCYGANVQDTKFDSSVGARGICENSIGSHFDLQAHSAPLGLAFLNGDLLVSYHGSWNRTEPTGYKVVRIELDGDGQEISREDFVSGWLTPENGVLGRPVDVLVLGKDIYISDDKAGVVYKLSDIN